MTNDEYRAALQRTLDRLGDEERALLKEEAQKAGKSEIMILHGFVKKGLARFAREQS